MLALLAWILYRCGGEIQHIVTTKINTRDVRSATVIDFIYGSILLFFKEWSDVPKSTTWVFLALLAGREFAIGMDTWLRTNRETAMIVVKDAFKAAIGLGISIAMALGPLACGESFEAGRSARALPLPTPGRRSRARWRTGPRPSLMPVQHV